MTKRIRLLGVQIHPQLVLDDGETLTPLNVQPQVVNAADWPDVHALIEKATADLEAQVNAEPGTIEA